MTALSPPSGAVPERPTVDDCAAQWRHADRLPYMQIRLRTPIPEERNRRGTVTQPARPPCVDIATGPSTMPLDGVTDPRELRQCAWLFLRAADWLEAQAGPQPEPEPDPQTSVYDHVDSVIKVGAR